LLNQASPRTLWRFRSDKHGDCPIGIFILELSAVQHDFNFWKETVNMTETKLDRGVIFVLRILIGWTFLYAGSCKSCRTSTPPASSTMS
jgi:hypothetical protein